MAVHALLPDTYTHRIVRRFFKFQFSAILHVFFKLNRVALAEILQRGFNLLFLDVVVFFIFGAARQSLPWKLTLEKVKQDMADTFEIVPSGLLNSFMGCNGGISGSSCQVLAILVRNMNALVVLVALGEPKINDVNIVPCSVSSSDQEVVGLDISVNESLFVHLLDSLDKLYGNV